MSKSSYFDWELSFRKNQPSKEKVNRSNREKINSIGIPLNNFKKILQEWKEKNLN